jgi:hypothetical protein
MEEMMKDGKRKASYVWKNLGWRRELEPYSDAGVPASDDSAQATNTTETQPATEDKPHKEGLFAKFQKHMAAAAFAELGEYESAHEILEPERSPRSVLLVMDGTTPDPTAFTYAQNLCKRTNAQLDILRVIDCPSEEVGSRSVDERIAHETQQVAGLGDRLRERGIPHKITLAPGDTNEEILNYTKSQRHCYRDS